MSNKPTIIDSITVRESAGEHIDIVMPSPGEYSFDVNDWAQQICKAFPGPYKRLNIDLRQYRSVNSIICAGFIHLYRHYQCEQASLHHVSTNVEGILKTLQLDRIFNIEFNTKRHEKDS